MKAKSFLIIICLFCAGVLSAQDSPFIQKWEQQARTRGASWKSFTRTATTASRPKYTSLYLKGKLLASFNDDNACRKKIDELVGIADDMYSKSAAAQTGGSNRKTKGQATRDLERMTGVDIDAAMGGLDNTLSRKKAEADAKRMKDIRLQVRGYCECRTENNPNYKSGTQSAKPNDFGSGDLFTDGSISSTDGIPDNPLLDGLQTQFDNPFEAPSARDPQLVQQGALPSVSLNFDDAEQYAGGIYVGNPNWKSDWQTQPELEELDYMTGKFDAIKKEIAVDLKFRDEVAESIRAFLENRSASIPQLMHSLYRERTGYDIEELRNKQYLTEEEHKIVEDYNHFVKQMAIELDYQANEAKKKSDPEKNLIDFAIMAGDVYKDGSRLLKDTDWRPLTSSRGIEDEAIARAIDAINSFNTQNNNNSGFYAQIYKNELTGEYTLAFRGTEMKSITDWKNNIQQGFSTFSEQYAFAASIGECLSRSDAKINIVGHSLGGGLATVAGLKTGFPTYTYNQADISQGTVDRYKLDVSKTDNITAHYVEGEILTALQNETREYNTLIPLGKKVKTGSIIATEESAVLTAVSKTGDAVGSVVPYAEFAGTVATVLDKGDNLLVMGDGHRMPSIEQYFRSTYSKSQVKWEGYNNVQMVLKNDKTYSSLLIDTK